MTSLAFILGVLPLTVSIGAGAEMRQAMGIAVFAGMIGVTAFGLVLTPVFYVALRALTGNRPLHQHGQATVAASDALGGPGMSGMSGMQCKICSRRQWFLVRHSREGGNPASTASQRLGCRRDGFPGQAGE